MIKTKERINLKGEIKDENEEDSIKNCYYFNGNRDI